VSRASLNLNLTVTLNITAMHSSNIDSLGHSPESTEDESCNAANALIDVDLSRDS